MNGRLIHKRQLTNSRVMLNEYTSSQSLKRVNK